MQSSSQHFISFQPRKKKKSQRIAFHTDYIAFLLWDLYDFATLGDFFPNSSYAELEFVIKPNVFAISEAPIFFIELGRQNCLASKEWYNSKEISTYINSKVVHQTFGIFIYYK